MLLDEISSYYKNYKETTLKNRFFTSDELHHALCAHKSFTHIEEIGKSYQQRPIKLYSFGKGPQKAMFWSQMHGNEPTATAAIADLFNFFFADDVFNDFRQQLLGQFTFYFVPMLNPDGALKYTRRNAQEIDINRDYLALQSPEAKILKNLAERLKPDFGFNLHDQDTLYQVGNTTQPSCMAFLAPSVDTKGSINYQRKQAMQIIIGVSQYLQKIIPGKIARFKDEFEPRSFGDNFQNSGICTILIESGGLKNDPEKQEIRKYNFMAILAALQLIALGDDQKNNPDDYFKIPENNKSLFHICLRNISFGTFKADIGLNYQEIFDPTERKVSLSWSVADVGDLSSFYAYDDFDCSQGIITGQPEIEKPANFSVHAPKFDLNFKNGILLSKNL